MQTLPRSESIREIVLCTFSDLCRRIISRAAVSETVLIRQGFYYGRAYRAGGFLATLIAETGTLSFYTDEGQLLRTISLAEIEQPLQPEHRQAA